MSGCSLGSARRTDEVVSISQIMDSGGRSKWLAGMRLSLMPEPEIRRFSTRSVSLARASSVPANRWLALPLTADSLPYRSTAKVTTCNEECDTSPSVRLGKMPFGRKVGAKPPGAHPQGVLDEPASGSRKIGGPASPAEFDLALISMPRRPRPRTSAAPSRPCAARASDGGH